MRHGRSLTRRLLREIRSPAGRSQDGRRRAEYDVLIGAGKTIARYQPKLLIELHHFDGNLAAHPVPDLLVGWGYQIQWVERWQLTSYILATPASAESAAAGPGAVGEHLE
jgi:hypothetical protein